MLLIAPLAIVGLLLFVAIGGEVVLLLWNWLLPPLFGWHQVTFWQALGILALCRILFGGFGRHGSHRSGVRRRMAERWDAHDPRGAGTPPADHARTLRLRPARQREPSLGSLDATAVSRFDARCRIQIRGPIRLPRHPMRR